MIRYFIIFLLFILTLQAAPARGGDRVFTQHDGTTFIGQAKGNEHLNWIQSSDGEILQYNPLTKNYELAEIKDNKLTPSGKKYTQGLKKAILLNSSTITTEDVNKLWIQKRELHKIKMGYGLKH